MRSHQARVLRLRAEVAFLGLKTLERAQSRDWHGRFASGGGGGPGVRKSLSGAASTAELNDAAAAEAKRITGRDIPFDMTGSDLQIAKEHVEGIMQGLERFPKASLVGVQTYGPGAPNSAVRDEMVRLHADASAVTQAHGVVENGKFVMKSNVYFNNERPAGYRATHQQAHDEGYLVSSTPTGTALHEMGHVVTNYTGTKRAAYDSAVELADQAGAAPRSYITHHVSSYASSDMTEFSAEAFADVMTNGSGASAVSRAAFDVIESAYRSGT